MSQRSQFNERYSEDAKPKGVTRKGAGTVKPKSTAAASVYIQPEKTKEQKKAARKQREKVEREKQERLDRKLAEKRAGNNKLTSPMMKKYRQWWWICLVAAIILTIISWFGRDYMPEALSFVTLILAYAAIVGALYLDLGKIRGERKRLEQEYMAMNTKASKAERRALRAEERAARKEVEAEMKAEKSGSADKQEGGLFSRSKKAATEAADSVVEKQQAAKAGK